MDVCINLAVIDLTKPLIQEQVSGDAPSNQPILAGVFPQRNVGTSK